MIVAVGVALVASSIANSWVKSTDVLSAGLATLGVGTFVLTFFLGPQSYITQGVNKLTRIQIIYRSYLLEIEALSDYDWYAEHSTSGPRPLSDVTATLAQWEDVTSKALQELESDPSIKPVANDSQQSPAANTPAKS